MLVSISGPTFLSVCCAILSGRDHLGGDHGYIHIYIHTIQVVTKVGSARRVPASDFDVGAEGAGGSTQVVVGLGSRQPPDGYFVAERQGRLRPPRRQVGLVPGRCPWLLQNNTLNEILVFDLSLATGLYALTIYAGVVLGIPASWYQPKPL